MGRGVPQGHSNATCRVAAHNGHLRSLQRERDRSDAPGCFYYYAEHYDVSGLHILEWTRENGWPGWPEDTTEN